MPQNRFKQIRWFSCDIPVIFRWFSQLGVELAICVSSFRLDRLHDIGILLLVEPDDRLTVE